MNKGFILIETLAELLITSIIILTVLAVFARTVLILKETLNEMLEINMVTNSIISTLYVVKDEMNYVTNISNTRITRKLENDDRIGLNISGTTLQRYKFNKNTLTQGYNLLSYDTTKFSYKNNILELQFKNKYELNLFLPLKGQWYNMASDIIETYKHLEEKIKSQEAKQIFEMLDSQYPSFKSRAIQELTKLNIDSPIIKEFLEDYDVSVRYYAFKHMHKLGILDDELIKKFAQDISPSIRKEAIVSLISSGTEEFEELIVYSDDPEPSIRYAFLITMLEFYYEDAEKIIEKMRKDPYDKIQKLIYSIENFQETLKNKEMELNIKKAATLRFFETNNNITFFNSIKEVYSECDENTKILVIKFLAGLPTDLVKSFLEEKINSEKSEKLLFELAKAFKKSCGIEDIPSWLVEQFVNSKDTKIIDMGLKIACENDDMALVDFCRNLLKEIDDNYIVIAVNYLLHFKDYSLSDHILDYLNSLSTKKINLALKIIKNLKLDNYLDNVAEISTNKKYPSTVRKNSLLILKQFKAKQHWEIPYNILKDPMESGKLKLASLNTLLKLNAQMVVEL